MMDTGISKSRLPVVILNVPAAKKEKILFYSQGAK